jgi:hypothetical protein
VVTARADETTAGVFSTSTPVSEGLTLDPDAVIHQKVTFAPTARGTATVALRITTIHMASFGSARRVGSRALVRRLHEAVHAP